MTKIGIVGGTGFTAGELIRLLVHHPKSDIKWVYSRTYAGKAISEVHPDLEDEISLEFTSKIEWDIDLIFLCLPHETARNFVQENNIPDHIKIIDLSRDFRLGNLDGYEYGLPELNKNSIIGASKIANPGCFATCIQLGLLPLASTKKLTSDIHVTAITGSTGAGKSSSPTVHFSWRTGNMSTYKVLKHQHLSEIDQSLSQLQNGFSEKIFFVPMRGNFTRGIIASIYLKSNWSQEEAINIYKDFYKDHPFVTISDKDIDLKQVVNTNKCKISIQLIDDHIHIVSTIDNLLKGASGQAVQNMNLICGYEETLGLKLKSIAY